jgi:ATP-binding cassette, subfamily C, bacterial PrsD
MKSKAPKSINVAAIMRRIAPWFIAVAIFSACVNLLALTGSFYMLQVYDRVISSRSVPTLIGISVIALMAYVIQGVLDAIRSRMLVRIGASFDEAMAPHVFDAVSTLSLRGANAAQATTPLRDLENVRAFLSGLGPTALVDLPFMPFFIAGCYLLHPWIGNLAIGGAILVVSMTVLVEFMSRRRAAELQSVSNDRHAIADACRRNSEAVLAMGFRGTMRQRWLVTNNDHVSATIRLGNIAGGMGSAAKVMRFVLQSAVLGLGGYLVINQEMSAGSIIACSIMITRALAPIEIAIAHWKGFLQARQGYTRLKSIFANIAAPTERTKLPRPVAEVAVESLYVAPPGVSRPTLQQINFRLAAGNALGIIGPSASGKSTLARAIIGAWRPTAGSVRIDGASLEHWEESELGKHLGYLPQDVELFDGTVAENIARFDPDATSETIVAAAQAAGTHELILRLPEGYETVIGEGGAKLSGGQRQRIGLARALYGDPFLVVLDEPNSNLDNIGEQALNTAISGVQARGGIAIVITHRTMAMAGIDTLAVMNDGKFSDYGPRDEVMRRLLQPVPQQVVRVQPNGATVVSA